MLRKVPPQRASGQSNIRRLDQKNGLTQSQQSQQSFFYIDPDLCARAWKSGTGRGELCSLC
jgi:hypothetical protein